MILCTWIVLTTCIFVTIYIDIHALYNWIART